MHVTKKCTWDAVVGYCGAFIQAWSLHGRRRIPGALSKKSFFVPTNHSLLCIALIEPHYLILECIFLLQEFYYQLSEPLVLILDGVTGWLTITSSSL